MNEKPVLYIVMGPSGAGKSYYGEEYVPKHIKIFDGDKEAFRIHMEEGFHLPGAYDRMNELLEKKANIALMQERDFAIESPIGAPNAVKKFWNKGYNIMCVFFGLNSLDDSIFRIQQRIEGNGNLVTPGDAKQNFEKSFKNVVEMKSFFDEIKFVSGSNIERASLLEAIFYNDKFELFNENCEWAKKLSIKFNENP